MTTSVPGKRVVSVTLTVYTPGTSGVSSGVCVVASSEHRHRARRRVDERPIVGRRSSSLVVHPVRVFVHMRASEQDHWPADRNVP